LTGIHLLGEQRHDESATAIGIKSANPRAGFVNDQSSGNIGSENSRRSVRHIDNPGAKTMI
jgi:hypothetical protein